MNPQAMTFQERLPLVRQAIEQRVQAEPNTNKNPLRARLWVSWLKKQALDVPAPSKAGVSS